jgi:hypothetical protein
MVKEKVATLAHVAGLGMQRSYCDTIQVRSDSDFGVKLSIVQFYAIEHNFKFNRWIDLKFDIKIPDILDYDGVKFQMNRCLKRIFNIG